MSGPMGRLAPMQLFHDIPVVPVTRVKRLKGMGGPIWPTFDTEVAARFCRNGIACDIEPRRPARMRRVQAPSVWGGFLAPHFGHLVAEHLTRLPQSLRDRPDDLYLFTVPPGVTTDSLPGYVWDVLDWFGLQRDQAGLVHDALLATELRVAAQGDMLGAVPPAGEFLGILAEIARRNGLVPEPNDHVFVTRAGLVPKGLGGHAGESYLADLLQRLGVRVIDPGQLPIRRQMELYAGADTLIFAEGSALHGRCLLGHVDQDIHVLRRRPNRNTAHVQLSARCRRLGYHAVMAGRLGTRTDERGNRYDLDLAIYDPQMLFAVFGGLGIDLEPHWDADTYRAAAQADLAAWLEKVPTSINQMAENLAVLADLDLLPDPVTPPPVLQCQT